MTMDWDKLKAFHAVAEAGSFTHAGDKIQLSQSAISRQISALEDSLGVTLFHRHARGLKLTEQGEVLLHSVKTIFRELQMVEGQLQDTKERAEGPLLITVSELIGSAWLSSAWPEFLEKYPNIKLSVILEDRILNLGMREADAAIRLFKPEQQNLIQKKLGFVTFKLCASKAYIEKYGMPKKASDLKNHMLIGHPPEAPLPYNDPNWHFKKAGIDSTFSQKTMLINAYESTVDAAKRGFAIASLPVSCIKQMDDLVFILEDDMKHKVDIFYVYPEEYRDSKRIALLKDFLAQKIQALLA